MNHGMGTGSGAVAHLRDILPQSLNLWADPVPRTGYFNMAADELLSRRGEAWLRIYRWARPAVSYGYFDTRATAESLFPGAAEYIRRWTGGGIVDHRSGYTYTLTLPAGAVYPEAAVLYHLIHGALAQALSEHGVPCRLLCTDAPDGGRACWASPVADDITDPAGHKLAGAGQRRRQGAVLHQGLVQNCTPTPGWEERFAALLCPELQYHAAEEPFPGFTAAAQELCRSKYEAPDWADESHGRR